MFSELIDAFIVQTAKKGILLELTIRTDQLGSWGDGSVVNGTDCFSRGPEFSSQQPHGGSQPSVIQCPLLECLKAVTVYSYK